MADFWKLKEGFTPVEDGGESQENKTEETKEEVESKTETEEKTEEVKDDKETSEEKKEEGEESKSEKEYDSSEETKEESKEKQDEESEEGSNETEEEERSLNKISELTDGEFESEEDIVEAYKELNSKISGTTLIEQLNSQVEEIHGEGISFADVMEYKNKDFDSMNEIDLIVENLYLQDPDITDAEIRAELRQFDLLNKSESEIEEMIEDEVITKDKVEDLRAKLVRESRLAKTALKGFQDEINIDDLEISSPKQPKEEPEQQQPSKEEIEAMVKKYNQTIDSLKEEVVQVGTDKEPHELKLAISDEDRKGIKEFLSGDETQSWSQKRWFNDDGTVNIDLLATDVNKIINYERNLSVAFQQGKTAGVSKEVKDIDNVDFGKGETRDVTTEGKSEAAKIVREIN